MAAGIWVVLCLDEPRVGHKCIWNNLFDICESISNFKLERYSYLFNGKNNQLYEDRSLEMV